ncbi:hypothetical protein [Fodinibius sp. AD559]|uniref:hypothetical protein n=1 Tax=Fodinibius sp. AD559 TaxID=3424179 RepID=UPI004046A219
MSYNASLSKAKSIAELKQVINQSNDFEDGHLKKVDAAVEYFKERLASMLLQDAIKVSDIP